MKIFQEIRSDLPRRSANSLSKAPFKLFSPSSVSRRNKELPEKTKEISGRNKKVREIEEKKRGK